MIEFRACLETVAYVHHVFSISKVSTVFALGFTAIDAKRRPLQVCNTRQSCQQEK